MNTFAQYPSLAGRSVLISGGASGIGETLVEQFVLQGARVGFIDIDAAAGRALAQRLAGAAHAPLFVQADVTDIAALRRAVQAVRMHCGPITVLLNNAANDARHDFDATTPEGWDATIAVNLKHQFFAAQSVASDMAAAGGGSIINFGSCSWMLKMPDMPAYTAAKAGVQGLTRTLARKLGPHRIRVNTLVPGWVRTDKQRQLWGYDQAREEIARNQCLADPLLPQHIASMALFLAADDSAMCTAQDFIVDGGWV